MEKTKQLRQQTIIQSKKWTAIGSVDERNYHLRALMAIANIVEEKEFVRNWLAAEDTEHLRDLILLSNRNRNPE